MLLTTSIGHLLGLLHPFYIHHCQKSLPKLDEQIKKQLWDVRNELKEREAGPPQDPKGAKQFLIKVRI